MLTLRPAYLGILSACLAVGCSTASPVALAPTSEERLSTELALPSDGDPDSSTDLGLDSSGDPAAESELISEYQELAGLDSRSRTTCTWDNSTTATAKKDLKGSVDPLTGRATLTNHSQVCTYPVGFASYEMVDKGIDSQILFDHTTTTIAPGQSLTFTIDVPSCAFQVDLFFGDLIREFRPGIRYRHRLIGAKNNGAQTYKAPYRLPFCPKPTPTPQPLACVSNPTLVGDLFNIFVTGDLTQTHTDAEGRVAVGGNAQLLNYSVGEKLQPSQGKRDDLIVGKTLSFRHGTVVSGNMVFGHPGSISNVTLLSGTRRQGQALNFPLAAQYIASLSHFWKSVPANGQTTTSYGQITLVGRDPKVNVFALNAQLLATAHSLAIQVPAHSSVLVTVSGSQARFAALGIAIQGTQRQKVVYHFPDAQDLTLDSIGIEGSIVAPKAQIVFNNGVIHGAIIGESLEGSGQSNHAPFNGCLPAPLSSVSVASLQTP